MKSPEMKRPGIDKGQITAAAGMIEKKTKE
jgi:hypothetical protein